MLAKKDTTEEARREAARAMGSARTPAKTEAARRNGFKPGNQAAKNGGRKPKPLGEISCKCGVGEALEGHKWDCPKGQAIKRRQAEGLDLVTGAKVSA